MTKTNASPFYQEPAYDEIALNAFLLWEKEGRQSGREMHYWLQAEGQLREARRQKAEAAAAQAAQPWPRPASTAARRKPPTLTAPASRPAASKGKRSARVAA
jgi:hypothetical protein